MKNKCRLAATALIAALALTASLATAQQFTSAQQSLRTITVSGEAEVQVVPDEVVLTLGAETRNKDLADVKRQHEQRMKKVLAALSGAGVQSKDIRTDFLQLEPIFDYNGQRRTFIEYAQRTTAAVTLRDVSKFESLLTSVLQNGVEYIHGVEFRTSELRKHRDAARAMALKAAREKATAMAGELGQKPGKPQSIQEGHGSFWSSYGSWWGRAHQQGLSQNAMQSANNDGGNEERSLAPGVIRVRASVSVAFLLE